MPDNRAVVKVQVITSDGLSFFTESASTKTVVPVPAWTSIVPSAFIAILQEVSISHLLVLALLYITAVPTT